MLARLATYAPAAARVAIVGWMAMLAAFLLLAADSGGSWERIYTALSVGGLIVGLATLVALIGLLQRSGTTPGVSGTAALVAAVVAVAGLTAFTWASIVWSGLFSLASVIALWRLRAAGIGSKVGTWALGAAWPVGFGLFVLLDQLRFGRVDEYGDYPWAGGIGQAVWCGLFALGIALLAGAVWGQDRPDAA